MEIVKRFNQYGSSFPDFETTPLSEKETKSYNMAVCQAIYGAYLRNETAISSDFFEYYKALRLYGMGKQPEDWYKTFLQGQGNSSNVSSIDGWWLQNKETQKKGWMNIDWSIRSLMPKIKSMLIPVIKNIDYDLKVNIIDEFGGAEEETAMNRAMARIQFGKIIDNLRQKHGVPVPDSQEMGANWEDLERMKEEGYFKPEHALQIEKICRHTEDISYWDETMYENLINDAIDFGFIAAEEIFDKETGKTKWEYINVERELFIMQYSEYNDFRDSEFGGRGRNTTISQLRQRYPEVDEKTWRGIAETYQGYRGNEKISDWDTASSKYGYAYDDYSVMELRCWWVDVEKDKKTKYKSKSGRNTYYDYDEKIIKKNSNAEAFITRKRILYHAVWIVGTDLCFDYGKAENQARPKMTKPMMPLFAYKFKYASLTERLKPVMDKLQIASLLYQNALSTASAGGWAIDVSMMDNITDGDKSYSIPEILKMWQQRKVLLHQASLDGQYRGGATVPIQYIQGNLREELAGYIEVMQNCYMEIEQYTGISPVALGSTPTSDQAVGTTKLSYNSTMNALKHIVDACRYIKQLLGTSSVERLRLVFKADADVRKNYVSVIGENGVQAIMDAKKRGVQYGMKLVARATDMEKQTLMQKIQESSARRAQGQAGVNDGQVFELIAMIEEGASLRQVARRMMYFISKDEEKIQMMQQQAIEKQNQGLQQLEQIKGQNAQQSMQMQMQLENLKSKNKKEEIIIEQEAKIKVEREKMMNDRNIEFEKLKFQAMQVQQEAEPQI